MKRPFVRRALAGMAITLLVHSQLRPTGQRCPGAATASAPSTPALIPAPATLQAGEIVRHQCRHPSVRHRRTGDTRRRPVRRLPSFGGRACTGDRGRRWQERHPLRTGNGRCGCGLARAYTLDITPDGATVKARDELTACSTVPVTLWQLATQGIGDRAAISISKTHRASPGAASCWTSAPFPDRRRIEEDHRRDGPAQTQHPALAPDGRPGLAHRDQAVPEAHRNRWLPPSPGDGGKDENR